LWNGKLREENQVSARPDTNTNIDNNATPDAVVAAALSFVGDSWGVNACWNLANSIATQAGAALPATSDTLGVPGVASGEWVVAFNGPAGQTGNWQSMLAPGDVVVYMNSPTSGHITTVVSGYGSSAELVDNIQWFYANGQPANASSTPGDIIVSAPFSGSAEFASALPGSVVVYELNCPVITVTAPTSSVGASGTHLLAPLFTATNPVASQAVTEYQIYDIGTGGATADVFEIGNTPESAQSAANALTLSAAQMASAELIAGSSPGTDTVEVRASNGEYWGDWASFTINITAASPSVAAPIGTATSIASLSSSSFTATVQETVAASSLVTIGNSTGDNISQYSFEDAGGNGHFTLAGLVEPNGQAFTVSANELNSVQYIAGSAAGTDTLTVDAYDATANIWLPAASVSAVTAASVPFTNVADVTEAVYIGYFGRAGDPTGESYWLEALNSGTFTQNDMAASFAVQPEATGLYAFLANPSNATLAQIDTFIDSVFQNVFNRAVDANGLAYWQSQLQASLGNPQAVSAFIVNVISGAQGADATTISNKVTVADYLTQTLITADVGFTSSADALAHTAIASVTSDSSTVLAAESTINSWLAAQSSATSVALIGLSHASATSSIG
jgi:hypothetical protein